MEKKMVRPYMTVEARDALDRIHSKMKREDRSESILMHEIAYEATLSAYDDVKLRCDLWKEQCGNGIEKINSLSKKNQEWKVYCAVLACTTIASLVALAIQAA